MSGILIPEKSNWPLINADQHG